ncbi:MAG: RibD family protein [Pseudomonadota bacterium]|nr:RibD family protein [Pseudomonadota bacterium]
MSGVKVTLKVATSLDARIALSDGTSQWITCSESRARAHQLRAAHDAILVGIGTVLADDPLLTARTVPLPKQQPVRIVADSHGRTPRSSRLVQSAASGRVVVATNGQPQDILAASGVEIWRCGRGIRVDVTELVRRAEIEGISSILIEGGGTLAASFIRAGLVDEIAWFRAPILIGGDGLPALGALGINALSEASRWRAVATERIGVDVLDTYVRV